MTREEAKELLLNISAYDIDMQRGRAKKEAIEMAIKALEHEPCEDAISRQALKDLGAECIAKRDENGNLIPLGCIDNLPSVSTEKTGRWIPVSEKLPEVGSEVLVCYDFKGKRSVYIANLYGDGEFYGLDDEYLTSEGRKYRKAIAWRPLPQPYKGESEDKE